MPELTEDQKEIILTKLKDKGADKPCPRCGKDAFYVLEYYFHHGVQEEKHKTVLGGRHVPVAVLICNNCGFISQHALGILGLLDKD